MWFYSPYGFTERPILIYRGITHASGSNFYYKASTREFLVYDDIYNLKKPKNCYRIDNCYYSHNDMFLSVDLSGFGRVKQLSAHSVDVCFILYENGDLGYIQRPYDFGSSSPFLTYLRNAGAKSRLVRGVKAKGIKSQLLFHYQPERPIHYISMRFQTAILGTMGGDGAYPIVSCFEESLILTVKFRKEVGAKIKDVTVKPGSSQKIENMVILLDNGKLFTLRTTDENKDSFIDADFEKTGYWVPIFNKSHKKLSAFHCEEIRAKELLKRPHKIDQISQTGSSNLTLRFHFLDEKSAKIHRARFYFNSNDSSSFRNRLATDLKLLRLSESSRLPEPRSPEDFFFINDTRPESSARNHNSNDSEWHDIRVELFKETCGDLEYPFAMFFDPYEKKVVARTIPEDLRTEKGLDLRRLMGRAEQDVNTVLEAKNLLDTLLRDVAGVREAEEKSRKIWGEWAAGRAERDEVYGGLPDVELEVVGKLEKEEDKVGHLLACFASGTQKLMDLAKKAKSEEEERKKRLEEEREARRKANVKLENALRNSIAFIVTRPDQTAEVGKKLKGFLESYYQAEDKYISLEGIQMGAEKGQTGQNGENQDSGSSGQKSDKKTKENESEGVKGEPVPPRFILKSKTIPKFDDKNFKPSDHIVKIDDFFATNPFCGASIYLQGSPKTQFHSLLSPNWLPSLRKTHKVTLVPDIFRMNKTEWERFKQQSKPIWNKQITIKRQIDGEEVEEEVNEYTQSVQEFIKYRDAMVGRMKTARYPRETCQISSLFYKPTNQMEEITDGFQFTEHIKREKAFEVVQGLVWLNHKIFQHLVNSVYVDGVFWEQDRIGEYGEYYFDTFNASLQRTVEEDTIKLYVDRMLGEKSSYEHQECGLLNQMYFYLMKWASNSVGFMIQMMRFNFEFTGERK